MLELAVQTLETCAAVGPGNFWMDSCFWRAFFTSPGLGALAAVLAALLVWRNSAVDRRRAREAEQRARDEDRSAKWWAATMWAADHSFSINSDEAGAGFEALEALQNPLWEITKQETAFIATLTRDPINEFTAFEVSLSQAETPGTIGTTEEENDAI